MNIYVDESGTFVSPAPRERWSVVVAVAAAEPARRVVSTAVQRLRTQVSAVPNEEVKLSSLTEKDFLAFLRSLDDAGVVLFATATDAGLNTPDLIATHQANQVANIRDGIPRMKYEGGRLGVTLLANQLESLPQQLYVQLVCQVNLLHDVVSRAISYFAQRYPASLREFRWRIDQKNTTKTTFEDAFEKVAPALLQTRSIREPLMRVREFDYSHLQAYEYEDGMAPDYLQTEYGLPPMEAINIQKLIRGNLSFQDSKASDGIQVADLLASGLRRILRCEFIDTLTIAQALGRLTLQNARGRMPIDLISLAQEQEVIPDVARIVKAISKESRPMFSGRSVSR